MTTADSQTDRNELARRLDEARRAGTLLDPDTRDVMPDKVADSYYIQDRLIALAGAEPRMWKLGATAKVAQTALGLDEPFSGPVLQGLLHGSPARVDASAFACHCIEPEIAITLGKDIDVSSPIDADAARAAIGSYCPAIEIINFRVRDGRSLDARGMIADLGANGGLVLGAPADMTADNYWGLTLDVRVNGKSVAQRTPPPQETDIPTLLAWFATHLASRGYSLRKGDVITTGSQAGIIGYSPGDLVEADFGGAGIASVQF